MHGFLIYTPVCAVLNGYSVLLYWMSLNMLLLKFIVRWSLEKGRWIDQEVRGEASVTEGHGKDRTFCPLKTLMDDKAGDQY